MGSLILDLYYSSTLVLLVEFNMTFKSSLLFIGLLVGVCHGVNKTSNQGSEDDFESAMMDSNEEMDSGSCDNTIDGVTWDFNTTSGDLLVPGLTTSKCAEKCISLSWCRGYTSSLDDDSSGTLCHLFHQLNRQHSCNNCSKCESGTFKAITGVCTSTEENLIGTKASASELSCLQMCQMKSDCNFYSWLAGKILNGGICLLFKECTLTPSCESWKSGELQCQRRTANSCDDIQQQKWTNISGVYSIDADGKKIKVFCDMTKDAGGWTVLQNRGDNGNKKDYFYQNWDAYEKGFGNPSKDFWVGLRYWHNLTFSEKQQMLIILTDWNNISVEISLDDVTISDAAKKYTLGFSKVEGKYRDSMIYHKGAKFSTKDQDNDIYEKSCSQRYKGAWWYTKCHHSNLNGLYLRGKHSTFADGVNWYSWRGHYYSLKATTMMIRPMNRKYKLPNSS